MKTAPVTAAYMSHHGDDLLVVNAARASFDKESWWADAATLTLKEADAKLIRYLATGYRTQEWDEFLGDIVGAARMFSTGAAKDTIAGLLRQYKRRAQHFLPFCHPHLTMRLTMPIFLARQMAKSQVGGSWSEASRRYISDEPSYYFPSEWHTRPEDVKQGSGGLVPQQGIADSIAVNTTQRAIDAYNQLLGGGVAPEEARTILPLNMMTTVVWTGSLLFWSRVVNQRVDGHAQLAAQVLGKQISAIVGPLFPVSWKELTGGTE